MEIAENRTQKNRQGMYTGSGQQTVYDYEPNRNLKTQVQNSFNGQVISQYDYKYDELGRRTSVVNTGLAFNTGDEFNIYEYDDRNQLTGSSRYEGNDIENLTVPVDGEYRSYNYDPIGNREDALEGDKVFGYSTNSVNQYESFDIDGQVNSLVFDADGNMTQSPTISLGGAASVLVYNGENRLTAIEPQAPADGDEKYEYVYDYQGRRVEKIKYQYQTDTWDEIEDTIYVYEGWNLIEEIKDDGTDVKTKNHIWGLDLSQTTQGAGGVGGLLASVDESDAGYFMYDGNGNVGQLVNNIGELVANYEYDPFGNLIVGEGVAAQDNLFRFSTKYYDVESGGYYYGFRYYLSGLGRWNRKDPAEEWGGLNLYRFVGNNSNSNVDILGENLYAIDSCRCRKYIWDNP